MNYYPKIEINTTPHYIFYEETIEKWNLFTGTRAVKTGNIKSFLDHTHYNVSTNVRLKYSNKWYIIKVSESLQISAENKHFDIESLINRTLEHADKVQKYFILPKELPEWIELDKNQDDVIKI